MDLKTYLSGKRGRLTALSKAIGAHRPDVSDWASGKRPIPILFGLPIEEATEGSVTRQEMFSAEIIAKVWPELMKSIVDEPGRTESSDDVQPPGGGTNKNRKSARMAI